MFAGRLFANAGQCNPLDGAALWCLLKQALANMLTVIASGQKYQRAKHDPPTKTRENSNE